ncbi:MAG TPA: hypothetical protein VFG78_05935 [Gemmatimonadota bacterium]|nr:hypothetical protein [Gemmatimonadota bacterium]
MRSWKSLALGVAAILAAPAPTPLQAQEVALVTPSAEPMDAETAAAIEAIRSATAKYADPEVALAEGYVRDPANLCALPDQEGLPVQLGAMGIHFFRPDLLQITAMGPRVAGVSTHTDFLQPSVLIYVPDESGALKLGAVENLVFEGAWKEAGNAGPPEFHGRQYWHRIDNPATPDFDEAHLFEPHYELHIWLHHDNPSGMFSQYNPAVSCDTYDGPKTMAEAMEYMAAHTPPPADQP